mgnify:CR=1 FL=1
MAVKKVAITLDEAVLSEVDRLVRQHEFPSRSKAIESFLRIKLRERGRRRLGEECAKLDLAEERALAEEGWVGEQWPAY